MALVIDAALYREAYAGLADWSREAEAYDQREAARRQPEENLAICFEVSTFLLRWAPPENLAQFELLDRSRRTYEANVLALEAWREHGRA